MEDDDGVLVVIVGNEEESSGMQVEIKQEVVDEDYREMTTQGFETLKKEATAFGQSAKIEVELDIASAMGIDEMIETAERHGKVIHYEKKDYTDHEYLTDECNDKDDDAYTPKDMDEDSDLEDTKEDKSDKEKKAHRHKMLQPWERKSLVETICKGNPGLRKNQDLLIETIYEIMCATKPPPPPKDYFIMTGDMFECVQCGALTETLPAASRHWREKHGERYLMCFACGVDFRSTTNLYKHEKLCKAPDASIVLKARALILGRKGRGRPFKPSKQLIQFRERVKVTPKPLFECSECPAKFKGKLALKSHEFAHRGARPFRCRHCPAAYTSRVVLRRHTLTHTGQKFICDHCSKSYMNKNSLIVHLDTHLPLRKWVCTVCERRFSQKAALKLHTDRDHLLLPPPCACRLCPKRFSKTSVLKTHMMQVHGMNIMTKKMFYKSLPLLSETQLNQAKIVMKSELEPFAEQVDTYNEFEGNDFKVEEEDYTELTADVNEVIESLHEVHTKMNKGRRKVKVK